MVLFVPGNVGDMEAFGVADACGALGVYYVVGGLVVVFLKDGGVYNVFSNKCFVCNFYDFNCALFGKGDDIV